LGDRDAPASGRNEGRPERPADGECIGEKVGGVFPGGTADAAFKITD